MKKSLPRIGIADNIALTSEEYEKCKAICTIITQLAKVSPDPMKGGIFWEDADKFGPFTICQRADYKELNLMLLLNTRFRDYPALVYAYEELTPQPDYWVKRYISLAKAVPLRWRVRIPKRLGEVGFDVEGFPVNRCVGMTQERITAMLLLDALSTLEKSQDPRSLEIGGGAGEIAHSLCNAIPGLTHYNCDLLFSLAFNVMRLAVLLPNKKHKIYVGNAALHGVDESFIIRSPQEAAHIKDAVINIPHHLLDDFRDHLALDFACNTWSFAEMPMAEVQRYGTLIYGFLRPQGALFEQNEQIATRNGISTQDVFSPIFHGYEKANNRFWDMLTIRVMSGSSRVWRKGKAKKSLGSLMRHLRYRWMLRNGFYLFQKRRPFDTSHFKRLKDIFGASSPAIIDYAASAAKKHAHEEAA